MLESTHSVAQGDYPTALRMMIGLRIEPGRRASLRERVRGPGTRRP